MMVMQKPVDKAVYDAIEAKKGKLLMGKKCISHRKNRV